MLHRQNRIWNLAKYRGHTILLHEVVGTVARQPRNLVGEIDVACLLELFDFVLWCDFVQHLLEVIAFQDCIPHTLQLTAHPENGL